MAEEIAVIGAGITGAFTAYLLARDGHPVVLLDGEAAPYRGTNCNPGGINPLHGPGLPQPMAEFYLLSHRLHSRVREEVMTLSGIDYGFRVIDRLFLAFSLEEQQQLQAMGEAYNACQDFSAQWYEPGQLKTLDQRISERALGGLFTHGNSIVDSQLYCEALVAAAVKLGCRTIRSDVCDFVAEADRVTHVETAEATVACSAVVMAAGYATDSLSSKLGIHVPVKPVKGELLLVKLSGPSLGFDVTWGLSGLYQYKDDLVWLGGTRTAPTGHPETTEQGKSEILAGCKAMLPGLGPVDTVAHEAGYRPQSADKLPLVGFLPGYKNLLVATGGGSKGVLVSAGIAEAVRNMIASGGDGGVPYLAPGRFHASA